jgi:hypothetical protein
MNPDTKEFEEIKQDIDTLYQERPETREWKKFHIGERVEVKGENFLIRKITKKDLILRPMRSSSTTTGTPE